MQNIMNINMDLLEWFTFFFFFLIKKTSGGAVKNQIMSKQELGEELHKPIIRKFEKRKAHSPFIKKIRAADFADVQLIIKYKKNYIFICYWYF